MTVDPVTLQARSFMTAVFRLWSKSTKVSEGHKIWRRSSRVTSLAGMFEEKNQDAEGLLSHLDRSPVATQFHRAPVHFKDAETPGLPALRPSFQDLTL